MNPKLQHLIGRVLRMAVDEITQSVDMQSVTNTVVEKALAELDSEGIEEKIKDRVSKKLYEEQDWSDVIDYGELVGEIDYRDLSAYLDVSEVAAEVNTRAFLEEVTDDVADRMDYDRLGEKIDYAALAGKISPVEALGGAAGAVEALAEAPEALIDKLLEKAVDRLLAVANDMVEKEEQEAAK